MLLYSLLLIAPIVAAAVAGLARRKDLVTIAASLAGLLAGAVIAAQPMLFRAENGFFLSWGLFGGGGLLIGVVIGLLARSIVPSAPGRPKVHDR